MWLGNEPKRYFEKKDDIASMVLVILWLRRWGIKDEICWQRDWRKGVGRSHWVDECEFYIPLNLKIKDEKDFLNKAQAWQYVYNVKRPHFGEGMNGKTCVEKLN